MKWAAAVAAVCAFVVTAVFRFMALNGFPNDHFQHLAGAQQILMIGEWPTKDFFDPGLPLMYVVSAGAQLLLGQTLFAEAVLVSVAYGLANAFTLFASWKLSRSLIVAMVATSLCVAIFPRSYGYPKALLYAAVPLVLWTWMAKPTLVRLVWPSLLVAVAFLFRHDHGVYIGAVALAGILLTPAEGWRQVIVRSATFGALVVVLLTPYLLYVQLYEGLESYIRTGVEFSSREADRTQLHLEVLGWGDEARLFYGFHALPLIALVWASWDRFRGRATDFSIVVALALMAIFANVGFLRDPLSTRLPDVIGPAALVGAWLAGRGFRSSGLAGRLATLVICLVVVTFGARSVAAIGNPREQLSRTELSRGIGQTWKILGERTAELTARFTPRQMPDGRIVPLVPFFEYLDRCTTSRHRLLVVGYAPEIFVYAQRAFGGGQNIFVEGYLQSEERQQRVIDQMDRQVVQYVLVLTDVERANFARLHAYLDSRFEPMVDVPVSPDRTVRILVNTGFPQVRVDKPSGWPCYL